MIFGDTGKKAKIAVFDINHGAVPLARKIASFGYDAVAFDVYEKTDEKTRKKMSDDAQVPVSVNEDDLDDAGLVIAPVHLTPENRFSARARKNDIPVITHHEAVGRILKNDPRLSGRRLIEISGVKGKTSTATLYAEMASFGGRTALHTSRGIEIYENGIPRMIHTGGRISPSRMPDIIDEIFETGQDPATLVFELSLGCTGAADISVITTLDPAYPIAGNSSDSTAAKTAFLKRNDGAVENKNGLLISGARFRDIPETTAMRIGLKTLYADVSKTTVDGVMITVGMPDGKTIRCRAAENYDAPSYKTAFSIAAALAQTTGVSEEDIAAVIGNFRGIDGRMRETVDAGRIVLDNSNSGLDETSCRAGIAAMLRKYGEHTETGKRRFVLVIGENAKEVCEGFAPEKAAAIMKEFESEIDVFVPIGKRLTDHLRTTGALDNCRPAADLNAGLETAAALSEENDVIISAVKCFR